MQLSSSTSLSTLPVSFLSMIPGLPMTPIQFFHYQMSWIQEKNYPVLLVNHSKCQPRVWTILTPDRYGTSWYHAQQGKQVVLISAIISAHNQNYDCQN